MGIVFTEWRQKKQDSTFGKHLEFLYVTRTNANDMEVNVQNICVYLWPNNEIELRPELSCNHEELDTGMLLYFKSNIRKINISSPYTDVFLTRTATLNKTDANLSIRTDKKNKARIIQLKYGLNDMQLVLRALPGLHAFAS